MPRTFPLAGDMASTDQPLGRAVPLKKLLKKVCPPFYRWLHAHRGPVDYWLMRLKQKYLLPARRELTRHGATVQQIEDLKKQFPHETAVIFLPTVDWHIILHQRTHHLATTLAQQGTLVVYSTHNFPVDQVDGMEILAERLILTDRYSYFLRQLPEATVLLMSTQQLTTIRHLQKYRRQGHRLVYDYIDDIADDISGHSALSRFQRRRHQYILENQLADLVVCTAQKLYDEVRQFYPADKVLLIPNGVDRAHFQVTRAAVALPTDLQPVVDTKKPIIGYYGALAGWLDYELLNDTARAHPEWQFVYLGADYGGNLCHLDQTLPNVHFLGPKPYADLPKYGVWFDVAMIPFARGEIAQATSPLKMFEYMALRLPVVATQDLRECEGYTGVFMARNEPADFANQIKRALAARSDRKILTALDQAARDNDWQERARQLLERVKRWPVRTKWSWSTWSQTHPQWATLGLLVLSLTILGGASLWVAAYGGQWQLLVSYLFHPLLLLLNFWPWWWLGLLIYLVTRRPRLSLNLTTLVIVAGEVVNYLKMAARGDPLVWADWSLIGEAVQLGSRYLTPLWQDWYLGWGLGLIVVLLVGLNISVVFWPRPRRRPGWRWWLLVAGWLGAGALTLPLYFNYRLYNSFNNYRFAQQYQPIGEFVSRGFVYPFLYSRTQARLTPPPDYDEARASELLASYPHDDIPEERKINLVVMLLEAYTDFSELAQLDIDESVYAPWHKLQAEAISGHLLVDVFGGGTIDTERKVLTGFTKLGNFLRPTNSYVWYLRSQGYTPGGIHPHFQWFYNRQNISPNLGFRDFAYRETRYSDTSFSDYFYFPDQFLLPDVAQTVLDSPQPFFYYVATIQNHGPYSPEAATSSAWIARPAEIDDATYNYLNNYLDGIRQTNQQLVAMIEQWRTSGEPLLVVLFGDHKPWLGEGASGYAAWGINLDVATAEGMANYYSTPYLIWANDAAQRILASGISGGGGDVKQSGLLAKVFELAGWGGDEYLHAYRDLVSPEGTASSEFADLEYYWQTHFQYREISDDH